MTTTADTHATYDTARHRAGKRADCPAAECAGEARRLAWVAKFESPPSFETLNINLTDMHFRTGANRVGDAELTIYKPSDALLEALVIACTGELARRQEQVEGAL